MARARPGFFVRSERRISPRIFGSRRPGSRPLRRWRAGS